MAQTRTDVQPPFSANQLASGGATASLEARTSSGRALHYYARLLVACTLILVAAGGMVTSTNSGLSVPDWPTTYGQNMFTFPLQNMVGGIFYEHGHRLIASTVGFLTIGMVAWLWFAEPRAWVRKLGWIALGVVILQGTLGGLTVLFFLPDAISISHAGLAQIFFCLTVSLALFTSRGWKVPAAAPSHDTALQRRLIWLTGLVYLQILLGATMTYRRGSRDSRFPVDVRPAAAAVVDRADRDPLCSSDGRARRVGLGNHDDRSHPAAARQST